MPTVLLTTSVRAVDAPTWIDASTSLGLSTGIALLVAVALGVLFVTRTLLVHRLEQAAELTTTNWDDALVHQGVPRRLALLVAVAIVHVGVQLLPGVDGWGAGRTAVEVTQSITAVLFALGTALLVSAGLSAVNEIYETFPFAATRPIKGFLQVGKLVAFIAAGVVVVAVLTGRSPVIILSGLGAATAVLLLIFRDTILSLVAAVQLASNDMVRVGDWIEMPTFGADGDVVDVALHTVKVQNFDKTVVTIPSHKLVSESFKNWRGMTEAGGRRIMRSVIVDAQSVRFLGDDDVASFERFALLREYVQEKRTQLGLSTTGHDPAAAVLDGEPRLTNLGTFRAYVEAYLRSRDDIHRDRMTLLVRQLATEGDGIPIQVYCFTTTTAWGPYETVQADIFDHLYAALEAFDLRAFQHPTGADIRALAIRSPEGRGDVAADD